MDHVPPKQFYPKDIRKRAHGNLVRQPTHRKCSGNAPELYQKLHEATVRKGVCPSVFAYWYLYLPQHRLHWVATSYWDSVWFCVAFRDTPGVRAPELTA